MIARICKLALLSAVVACGCTRMAEPVTLDTEGVTPAVDYSHLAVVLDKAVNSDGLLLPKLLERHSERLDAQLRLLAVTGPTATPTLFKTPSEELAYWYNARAAWAMKLAHLCNCPDEMERGELLDRSFPLDGRTMSLAAIDELLAARDDWRVLVASPDVTFSRSRLPAEPFTAADVEQRIAERISALVDDPQRFEIDIDHRRIRVPPMLWQYRQRLIAEHNRSYGTTGANFITALLPHVQGSAHRRLQDATGYRVTSGRPSLLMAVLEQ